MATSFKDNYGTVIKNTLQNTPGNLYTDSWTEWDEPITQQLSVKPETPQFDDKYGSKVDSLMSALESQNRQGFQYNYNTDPAYQAYRKQYLREGQRATQDTMAAAAAMTGGRPSSYAATAAAQAGNNYAAQLSDKVPELYNQAYNRYLQQYQQQAQMLNAYQQQQQADYNRFSQERSYNYQVGQDYLRNLQTQQQNDWNRIYQTDEFNAARRQEQLENRQKQQSQDWNMWMQRVNAALNVGDFSMLKDMGFNVNRSGFANDLAIAQIVAQVTGDTSMLRSLFGKG